MFKNISHYKIYMWTLIKLSNELFLIISTWLISTNFIVFLDCFCNYFFSWNIVTCTIELQTLIKFETTRRLSLLKPPIYIYAFQCWICNVSTENHVYTAAARLHHTYIFGFIQVFWPTHNFSTNFTICLGQQIQFEDFKPSLITTLSFSSKLQ